jgi:type IV pilus assembly protein PilM
MTQSFDAGYNPGGYQASGMGEFNPSGDATMGNMSPQDDLAIDPITGLPIESGEDAAPAYSNDPFSAGDAGSGDTTDSAPAVAEATDPAFEATRGILEDLIAELRRSIDYYTGKGGSVSRVVLCGGGAKLNGLAGYIERSMGIQTELYDPLKNLNVAAKKASAEYINEYREQIAVAVGNGLHILVD